MEKLFDALVTVCCWLRVAASLTVVGVGLGVGAHFLLGGVVGSIAGGVLALLGAYLGVRLANHSRRRGHLLEVAYGVSPGTGKPHPVDDEPAKR